MIKVHRPLVMGVEQLLGEIFLQGAAADSAIESKFKQNRKWGGRDRRFVAETVYDIVRWYRKVQFVAEKISPSSGLPELIKVYGAVNGWQGYGDTLEAQNIQRLWLDAERAPRAIRESIPDWLDFIGSQQLGEAQWESEIHFLNGMAPVDLRVNSHLVSPEEAAFSLHQEGIETHAIPGCEDGLSLNERKNIFSTKAFQQGWIEIQDRASQRVAPLLQPEPGHRIVDACAGAGGKTLHLASLMKGKGKILALDIHQRKLDELQLRAKRNRLFNIETRLIDSSKVISKLANSADALLLDVPCTGLGVLRRNPDTKWKLQPADCERLNSLQFEILSTYPKLLRLKGGLVYATCSLLPSENMKQVQKFLESYSDHFKLEESFATLPSDLQGDGFFAARLRKIL